MKNALVYGKVDGSTYTGECACLVGTIANIRGCDPQGLLNIKPDMGRPIERFFACIKKGDTPETSQMVRIVIGWIDEFETLMLEPA